jgi:hypothetical protein
MGVDGPAPDRPVTCHSGATGTILGMEPLELMGASVIEASRASWFQWLSGGGTRHGEVSP